MGNVIHGIDISRYQTGPNDFARARSAGMAFGVQRWGIGSSYRDNTRFVHLDGIITAGMVPGAYIVIGARENGGQQARTFVHEVWRRFGTDQPMLFVVDAEISRSFGSPNFDTVYAAVRTIRELTGRPPICYIPKWYMQDRRWRQDQINLLHEFPWWQSRYPTRPPDFSQRPDPFAGWVPTIWQWSATFNCPGIPGHVDANVFYGEMSELRALAGFQPATPIHPQEVPQMFLFGRPGGSTFFVEGGQAAGLNNPADVQEIKDECRRAGVPLPEFSLDDATYSEFVRRFRDHAVH